MKLPMARGIASGALLHALPQRPGDVGAAELLELQRSIARALTESDDLLRDEDMQLTLYVLYELHYTGFEAADPDWEWSPALLVARSLIEEAVERAIRAVVPVPPLPEPTVDAVAAALFELTAPTPGPGLARTMARTATDEQAREFVIQRSIYTLKEADPHTWAIPRLRGRAKAALVEIQSDEYGGGRPERIHAELYAGTMRGMGLDDRYGAYIDDVPAITLASLNMSTLFGLHARLRGACVGHLAAFEMTSSLPCRMIGDGLRRLGYGPDVTFYYDEHVEADSVHEQIAGRDLAGGLVEAHPELLADVLFGASACLTIDGMAADHIRGSWEAGESSLRRVAVAS
jgi:hypothetical protein